MTGSNTVSRPIRAFSVGSTRRGQACARGVAPSWRMSIRNRTVAQFLRSDIVPAEPDSGAMGEHDMERSRPTVSSLHGMVAAAHPLAAQAGARILRAGG